MYRSRAREGNETTITMLCSVVVFSPGRWKRQSVVSCCVASGCMTLVPFSLRSCTERVLSLRSRYVVPDTTMVTRASSPRVISWVSEIAASLPSGKTRRNDAIVDKPSLTTQTRHQAPHGKPPTRDVAPEVECLAALA